MAIKDAYTSNALATILKITRQGVEWRASSEAWRFRPRAGRGGGRSKVIAGRACPKCPSPYTVGPQTYIPALPSVIDLNISFLRDTVLYITNGCSIFYTKLRLFISLQTELLYRLVRLMLFYRSDSRIVQCCLAKQTTDVLHVRVLVLFLILHLPYLLPALCVQNQL